MLGRTWATSACSMRRCHRHSPQNDLRPGILHAFSHAGSRLGLSSLVNVARYHYCRAAIDRKADWPQRGLIANHDRPNPDLRFSRRRRSMLFS